MLLFLHTFSSQSYVGFQSANKDSFTNTACQLYERWMGSVFKSRSNREGVFWGTSKMKPFFLHSSELSPSDICAPGAQTGGGEIPLIKKTKHLCTVVWCLSLLTTEDFSPLFFLPNYLQLYVRHQLVCMLRCSCQHLINIPSLFKGSSLQKGVNGRCSNFRRPTFPLKCHLPYKDITYLSSSQNHASASSLKSLW